MVVITALEIIVDSIARGLILALLGAGITLVFGLGSVLNLALGAFAIIAVIVTVEMLPHLPHTVAAALVGLAAVVAVGLVVDRTLLRFVYQQEGEARILLGIFITLGLVLFLEGLMFVYYPLDYSIPHGISTVEIAGVLIRGSTLITYVVATTVLVGLFLFLNKTYLGMAARTVFQDERGAQLCGINPRKIQTLVFLLSLVLVGVAGILEGAGSSVQAADAFELTVFGIIVSIVGGVRNVRGTIAAGFLLGFVITAANTLIGAYVSNVLMFAVAVIALIIRPEEIA